MNRFEDTKLSDAASIGKEVSEASQKIVQEISSHWQEAKAKKLSTGDTLYETPVSQHLHMENGDRLSIQRKGGKIIRLTDKDGNEVKVPGDSENLAPANAPMEMYRLSNGAMYINDKQSGRKTLLNTDGSKIVLDNEGLLFIQRDNEGVGFARTHNNGDALDFEPIYNKR